jgi:geranylgeranylglyceryl phosphate synthase family protein
VSTRTLARLPFDERGGLIVLVDPGRSTPDDAFSIASRAADGGACGFLVGDSLGHGDRVAEHVAAIRAGSGGAPVVQFPAAAADLSADVDAVLFLVLLSGRNPRYLIEEQLAAVPFFERNPHVVAVSTAYLLIGGGRVSSVERVTGTQPLDSDDIASIVRHVRAGQLMGLHATYLEAGSGATSPIGPWVIEAARSAAAGPLLVGGGITTEQGARDARRAGADYVVVGTLFERDPAIAVHALAEAARA